MAGHPRVSVRWQGFGLPKRGHSLDEYEDAYAASPQFGRFAVSDGASESSFAALWAKLLVEGFVHPTKTQDISDAWLMPLRQRWASEVDGRPLPWYAEAKREEGAFATLLGLAFRRSRGMEAAGRWHAMAVGDSCLFQVRQDCLVNVFPVTNSQDFGNRPALVGSRMPTTDQKPLQPRQARGRWRSEDQFFLATDALAEWFLREHEADAKPWNKLEPLLRKPDAETAFAAWIEELRSRQAIRNDDVTLLWIRPEQREAVPTKLPEGTSAPEDSIFPATDSNKE